MTSSTHSIANGPLLPVGSDLLRAAAFPEAVNRAESCETGPPKEADGSPFCQAAVPSTPVTGFYSGFGFVWNREMP